MTRRAPSYSGPQFNRPEAFQGANGWYISETNADGFHGQPTFGSRFGTAARAMAAYRARYSDACDACNEGTLDQHGSCNSESCDRYRACCDDYGTSFCHCAKVSS